MIKREFLSRKQNVTKQKKRNKQIEEVDKIASSHEVNMGMRWCKKYKINVEEFLDINCLGCIFCILIYDKEHRKIKCQYDEWYPGLIEGKSWKEIEDINRKLEERNDN
jgi:hypothetical protein